MWFSVFVFCGLNSGIHYLFPPASACCLGRGCCPPRLCRPRPLGVGWARRVVVLLIGIVSGYERTALLPLWLKACLRSTTAKASFVRSQGCKSKLLKKLGFESCANSAIPTNSVGVVAERPVSAAAKLAPQRFGTQTVAYEMFPGTCPAI